jgi:hypothetical protein
MAIHTDVIQSEPPKAKKRQDNPEVLNEVSSMDSIRIMLTLPGAQSALEGLNEKKQHKKSKPSSSKVSRY